MVGPIQNREPSKYQHFDVSASRIALREVPSSIRVAAQCTEQPQKVIPVIAVTLAQEIEHFPP